MRWAGAVAAGFKLTVKLTLVVQDGALILDVGEFQAEVHARKDEDGGISYLTIVTPLEGLPVEFTTDNNGELIMILATGVIHLLEEAFGAIAYPAHLTRPRPANC